MRVEWMNGQIGWHAAVCSRLIDHAESIGSDSCPSQLLSVCRQTWLAGITTFINMAMVACRLPMDAVGSHQQQQQRDAIRKAMLDGTSEQKGKNARIVD